MLTGLVLRIIRSYGRNMERNNICPQISYKVAKLFSTIVEKGKLGKLLLRLSFVPTSRVNDMQKFLSCS